MADQPINGAPHDGAQKPRPLNHRQVKSMQVAGRIYAEWKHNLFRLAQTQPVVTWEHIIELIDAAIRLCDDLIPDEQIRKQCILRFKFNRARCELAIKKGARFDMTLMGETCAKCQQPIAVDEPKTWIADGQYVCSKCQ